MTQKERQERSKEEIYRAAMAEFGSRGYDGANMEHICADHGISKGMMYHYAEAITSFISANDNSS